MSDPLSNLILDRCINTLSATESWNSGVFGCSFDIVARLVLGVDKAHTGEIAK